MSVVLHLIDGSNVVRRKLEGGARVFREIYHETLQLPAHVVPIWCWDGYHAKDCRRELYADYKAHRPPPIDGTYEVIKTVGELLTHTRALQISVPYREADDVIGHLAHAYAGQHEIRIVSNDSDFTQLCVLPGVTIEKQAKIEPHLLRFYKATVGDPGDGVPGIKGFGQGGWDKVVDHVSFCGRFKSWIDGGDWADFPELRPGSNKWLAANRDQAAIYYRLVGFFDCDPDEVAAKTKAGTPNPAAATAIMRKYLQ